jgi:lactam utilization protein B
MSEHEEPSQIGHLAEHYTRLKEEVRHVEDRVQQVQRAYQVAAISFSNLAVHDDHLAVHGANGDAGELAGNLHNLLSARELIDLLNHKNHLQHELDQVRTRLRSWLSYV